MTDTDYYKKITEKIYDKFNKDRGNQNYFYLFKIIYKIYLKKEYDNDDDIDVEKIYNSIINDGKEVIEEEQKVYDDEEEEN